MHFQNSLHVCVAMQTWYFYKVILMKVRFCSGMPRLHSNTAARWTRTRDRHVYHQFQEKVLNFYSQRAPGKDVRNVTSVIT